MNAPIGLNPPQENIDSAPRLMVAGRKISTKKEFYKAVKRKMPCLSGETFYTQKACRAIVYCKDYLLLTGQSLAKKEAVYQQFLDANGIDPKACISFKTLYNDENENKPPNWSVDDAYDSGCCYKGKEFLALESIYPKVVGIIQQMEPNPPKCLVISKVKEKYFVRKDIVNLLLSDNPNGSRRHHTPLSSANSSRSTTHSRPPLPLQRQQQYGQQQYNPAWQPPPPPQFHTWGVPSYPSHGMPPYSHFHYENAVAYLRASQQHHSILSGPPHDSAGGNGTVERTSTDFASIQPTQVLPTPNNNFVGLYSSTPAAPPHMPVTEHRPAADTGLGEETAAQIKRVMIHIAKKGNDVTESELNVFRALGDSNNPFHNRMVDALRILREADIDNDEKVTDMLAKLYGNALNIGNERTMEPRLDGMFPGSATGYGSDPTSLSAASGNGQQCSSHFRLPLPNVRSPPSSPESVRSAQLEPPGITSPKKPAADPNLDRRRRQKSFFPEHDRHHGMHVHQEGRDDDDDDCMPVARGIGLRSEASHASRSNLTSVNQGRSASPHPSYRGKSGSPDHDKPSSKIPENASPSKSTIVSSSKESVGTGGSRNLTPTGLTSHPSTPAKRKGKDATSTTSRSSARIRSNKEKSNP